MMLLNLNRIIMLNRERDEKPLCAVKFNIRQKESVIKTLINKTLTQKIIKI